MNKIILIGLSIFMLASVSLAQTTSNQSKYEIFAGYSNLQAEGIPSGNSLGSFADETNFSDNGFFDRRTGLHGVNAAVTGYFWGNLGLTGDFSYNQRNRSFSGTGATDGSNVQNSLNTKVVNLLGGPTFAFRNQSRLTPFVHGLAGIANTRFKAESSSTLTTGTTANSFSTSATDFALALGGGLDVKLNNRVAIRAFQFDWNPVFLRDRSINILGQSGAIQPQLFNGQRQDNFRFSFGVVFK